MKRTIYDGNTDDLLTGGMGRTGLAGATPPPIANAASPTAAELRKLAIYNNYRSLVDVNDVVDSSLRLANLDAEFQKLRLAVTKAADLPRTVADPDQLQQVFLNLLLNARDAMPNGGELSVSTFDRDGSVCVSIRDTGHGVEESVRNQIFDPFFTTKPAGRGTGLGLSVCYGIITAHGGRIELESHNTGIEFIVILPRDLPEA